MFEVAFTNGDLMTVKNAIQARFEDKSNLFVIETEKQNVLIPATHVLYVGRVKEDEYGNTVFI